MQQHGALLQEDNNEGNWLRLPDALSEVWGIASPMEGWYAQAQLDLRGLLAGDETGINFANVILQEPQPVRMITTSKVATIFMIDMLTTVKPTERTVCSYFRGPERLGVPTGFLTSPQTELDVLPDAFSQTLNPSQIVWGMWRLITADGQTILDEAGGAQTFGTRTLNSGYFGEGEVVVAPALYWTRICITLRGGETGYGAYVPSSNLVVVGEALDLTTPQEITQMMRAAQR